MNLHLVNIVVIWAYIIITVIIIIMVIMITFTSNLKINDSDVKIVLKGYAENLFFIQNFRRKMKPSK